jgi:hypothetical protein
VVTTRWKWLDFSSNRKNPGGHTVRPGYPWKFGRVLIYKGETNEHLDDIVRGSADCLDWRLHRLPRSRRSDPLVAGIRGDLSNPAFCDGQKDSVKITTTTLKTTP